MPIGAQYIYNLNFFCGFIIASSTYYLLCRLSPIPATSDRWMEVGDEIRNVSVAYGATNDFDEESASGSDRYKGVEDNGVRERKIGQDF